MLRRLLTAALLVALAAPLIATAAPSSIRVIDGDTLALADGTKVRLIGIDAPEVGQPGGDIATDILTEFLRGRSVQFAKDTSETDRYGRLLRYVDTDGVDVNAWLVNHGYARAKAYAPDTARQGAFAQAEQAARATKRGLWGVGVFTASTPAAPPVSVKPVAPKAQPQDRTVYITRTGHKYHAAGCRYLSKSSIPISLKDAQAQGYTPCSVCGGG